MMSVNFHILDLKIIISICEIKKCPFSHCFLCTQIETFFGSAFRRRIIFMHWRSSKSFDTALAAPALAPTLLKSKPTFQTKVTIQVGGIFFIEIVKNDNVKIICNTG
jgi:hypothetical protein